MNPYIIPSEWYKLFAALASVTSIWFAQGWFQFFLSVSLWCASMAMLGEHKE